MNGPVIVPTVWGNHIRVRQAYDADGTISGAGIDFLESDGRSVRDMETLTRLDALKVGMALCEFAHQGLSGDEALDMVAEVLKALIGPLEPVAAGANVFPFPTSSRPAQVPDEGPTGGNLDKLPPVGIVGASRITPPAPPQAGGNAAEGPAL